MSYKDGERLNHAIELLDAADNALRQNRNSTTFAVSRILYEAQKDLIAMREKFYRSIQRWCEQHGVALPGAEANGGEAGDSKAD